MAKIKSEDLLQSIRETAPSILARDVDKIDDVLESIGDAIKKLTTDYTFEHIQHDGVDKNGKNIFSNSFCSKCKCEAPEAYII